MAEQIIVAEHSRVCLSAVPEHYISPVAQGTGIAKINRTTPWLSETVGAW